MTGSNKANYIIELLNAPTDKLGNITALCKGMTNPLKLKL